MTYRSGRGYVAAAAFLSMLFPPVSGWGQEAITTRIRADGRVVFTNNLAYTPAAAPLEARPVDRLTALIDRASAQHGVDSRLVRAVIEVESAFNERAVSSAGALGLMQLMPATGARFGVSNFFDPAENIDGGVRYLKFLLDMFHGDLDLSLAAYNSGENRVARLGRIPAIPETQDYVRKVRSAYTRMGGWGLDPRRPTAAALTAAGFTNGHASAMSPDGGSPEAASVTTFYRTVDERGVRRFSSQ